MGVEREGIGRGMWYARNGDELWLVIGEDAIKEYVIEKATCWCKIRECTVKICGRTTSCWERRRSVKRRQVIVRKSMRVCFITGGGT